MHVLAFREDLGETFPGLPKALMAMWGDDRSQADKAYAEYDFTDAVWAVRLLAERRRVRREAVGL